MKKICQVAVFAATASLMTFGLARAEISKAEAEKMLRYLINASIYECAPELTREGRKSLMTGMYERRPDGSLKEIYSKEYAEAMYGYYITGKLDDHIEDAKKFYGGCEKMKQVLFQEFMKRKGTD